MPPMMRAMAAMVWLSVKIVIDCADPHVQGAFWAAALGYVVEENRMLIERLLFQHVPEPKTVKNRLHLDLHAGPDHRYTEVSRLVDTEVNPGRAHARPVAGSARPGRFLRGHRGFD